MDSLDGLLHGLSVAMQPTLLLAAFVGALVGTAIGVLPGLGPVAGAALILPLTFSMEPAVGLILIASIYVGAMYGGSTTAVLLNMPGEASSVVTTIDGYEMTRRGRAGAALAIMAVGSFVAGTIALSLVAFLSPVVSNSALAFGPAEFFVLTAGGLLAMARLSGGSPASGFFPLMVGILLATVGQDQLTASMRYTFGIRELALGIELVPVAIGLFGIAEILREARRQSGSTKVDRPTLRSLLPTRSEWRRSIAPWTRGSLVGVGFGLVPGPSATLSSFAAYRLEQAVSRNRRELGKGAVEGVAGPEAANNAAALSSLAPVLSLGLPFSSTLALMISAMIVHGIQPGPLLVTEHPDIFWGLLAALYIANIMLLVLNLPLVGIWVSVLRIPQRFLFPAIVLIGVIGAFGTRNSMLDVYVLVVMAGVGLLLTRFGFSLAPFILGLVLGPLVEKYFRESLIISRGDYGYFIESTLSKVLWALVALVMVAPPLWRLAKRRLQPGARAAAAARDQQPTGPRSSSDGTSSS